MPLAFDIGAVRPSLIINCGSRNKYLPICGKYFCFVILWLLPVLCRALGRVGYLVGEDGGVYRVLSGFCRQLPCVKCSV